MAPYIKIYLIFHSLTPFQSWAPEVSGQSLPMWHSSPELNVQEVQYSQTPQLNNKSHCYCWQLKPIAQSHLMETWALTAKAHWLQLLIVLPRISNLWSQSYNMGSSPPRCHIYLICNQGPRYLPTLACFC